VHEPKDVTMSNTTTIGGYVTFSGYTCELNPDGSFAPDGIAERPADNDPDGAAAALRRAGYQVTRMPQSFRSRMEFPLDDWMLVTTDVLTDDDNVWSAIMDEVGSIVRAYGGDFSECGPIPSDREPFAHLFDDPSLSRRH
jgi:hypothetical protein